MRAALPLFLCSLCIMAACGPQQGPETVAVVGEREISADELRTFVLGLPPGLRTDKEGQEARVDYLQTLIDQQLMLMEARRLGLDRDAQVLATIEARRRDYVIALYRTREIRPTGEVSEGEISRFFAESGLLRERLIEAILVDTEEKARRLRARLVAGAPFAELAREHSLDEGSASRGGLLGFVNRPAAERLGIPGALFDSLETGALSPPLPRGDGFHLVRFLQDRQADLQNYRAQIHTRLTREAQQEREAQKVEMLAYERHWRMDAPGFDLLQSKASLAPTALALSSEEAKTALFLFDGGQVSVGDYLEVLRLRRINNRQALADSAFIAAVATRFLLPPAMLFQAALDLGIPQEPEVSRWVESVRQEVLLERVRESALVALPAIGEDEVRQYYESYPERFVLPETVCFDEVLVPGREQAEQLRAEIDESTDLLELARHRGFPARQRGPDGLICMRSLARQVAPALWDSLQEAPLGRLSGPVLLKDEVYSLFKVRRRQETRQQPFEEARPRAHASLKQRAERRHFDRWIADLRQQYQDQVQIFADGLTEALPDALLAGTSRQT